MSDSNMVFMSRIMDTIRRQHGALAAERFIFLINSENFDYTEWQREHYDVMTPEKINQGMNAHSETQPFHGKRATVI